VGGTVRDLLMGRPPQDIDLIAAIPAEQLVSLGFRRVLPKSAAPIYFRFHDSLGKIEITTLDETSDLESDLRLRDVTVNAIALSLAGDLIDPLEGSSALEGRELHPCSEGVLSADPLRIFRLFRFEAHGWRMMPQARQMIREGAWRDHLSSIPVERFSGELFKALAGETPAIFFRRMIEFGVGEDILPEIFRMGTIPAGPLEYHPEGDLFSHSLQVLERVCALTDDVTTRFCALFHDLGKLSTLPELYPKHHGHDDAGFRASRPFADRLALPVKTRTSLGWVNRLHTTASYWDELRSGTKIRLAEDAVRGGVALMLPLVVAADNPDGIGMTGWEQAVEVVQLSTAALGIDPRLLAALPVDGVIPLLPARRTAFVHQKRVERFRLTQHEKNEDQGKKGLTPMP
jgi:tRNA nucleotidyltransferase (CCA-adding enzyme)